MRKLASIQKILAINKIPDADAIDVATVEGWTVVVKRGDFYVGELVIYLEIDSWVPHNLAPFLSKGHDPRVFEGVSGERLRTVRLRGQLSQGLILPIDVLPKTDMCDQTVEIIEGADVTDLLGIIKWEAPIPAELAGLMKGVFPSWAPRTDQERCQNLLTEIFDENPDALYELTMKLDGTSVSYYIRDGERGACSRNLELKLTEENAGNTIIKLFNDSHLGEALETIGRNIMVQGELMGPGIQGNRENLKRHTLFVFDIIDLDSRTKVSPGVRAELLGELYAAGADAELIKHVPILGRMTSLNAIDVTNIETLLSFADGASIAHPIREGVVFKSENGNFSWKAISNKFLLKEKN